MFEIEESSEKEVEVSLEEEAKKGVPDKFIENLRTAPLKSSLLEVEFRD